MKAMITQEHWSNGRQFKPGEFVHSPEALYTPIEEGSLRVSVESYSVIKQGLPYIIPINKLELLYSQREAIEYAITVLHIQARMHTDMSGSVTQYGSE